MTIFQRIYKNKDVEMLVAASTILNSAIANKTYLQSKRNTWADPFFNDLKTRIDTAIQTYLGIDSAKNLREATQAVISIQTQALKYLAEVRIQITEDFKKETVRKYEILNQLGFINYHKNAQAGSHKALISLLYQFKINLTDSLKAEIVAKGTAKTTLTTLTNYADNLKDVNIIQERHKRQRKIITTTSIQEFNDIYNQVISICKIAGNFYKNQPHLQDQFTYATVIRALNTNKTKTQVLAPPLIIAS